MSIECVCCSSYECGKSQYIRGLFEQCAHAGDEIPQAFDDIWSSEDKIEISYYDNVGKIWCLNPPMPYYMATLRVRPDGTFERIG